MVAEYEEDEEDFAPFEIDKEHLIGVSVCCLAWSEKLDVVALATVAGDVCIHRLSWHKWWQINVTGEDDFITCLSWNTDGSILAVATKLGFIYLYDSESSLCKYKAKISESEDLCISSLSWNLLNTYDDNKDGFELFDSSTRWDRLLTKLPTFDLHLENEESNQPSSPETEIQCKELLIVGCDNAFVKIFGPGLLPLLDLDVSKHCEHKEGALVLQSCALHVNDNSSFLHVSVLTENGNLKELVFDTSSLCQHDFQIQTINKIGIHLEFLMSYLDETIENMESEWEDIIVQFSHQLDNYEKENSCNGTLVENEFIQLFLLGTCSAEFDNFLVNKLSEQTIKKTATTLDLSYKKMFNLWIKHLNRGVEGLVFHTSEIIGLARFPEMFEVIGLDQEAWEVCLCTIKSFMLKIQELMKLLQRSRCNLRHFFSWLYIVIQNRKETDSEDPNDVNSNLPKQLFDEMSEATPQEMANVLKENLYLRGKTDSHFESALISQYFKDENLKILFNETGFSLSSSETDDIRKFSLVQLWKKTKLDLYERLSLISQTLSESVFLLDDGDSNKDSASELSNNNLQFRHKINRKSNSKSKQKAICLSIPLKNSTVGYTFVSCTTESIIFSTSIFSSVPDEYEFTEGLVKSDSKTFALPLNFLADKTQSIDDIAVYNGDLAILHSNEETESISSSNVTLLSVEQLLEFYETNDSSSCPDQAEVILGTLQLCQFEHEDNKQATLVISSGRGVASALNKYGNKVTVIVFN